MMIDGRMYPCVRCVALFKSVLEAIEQFVVEVTEDSGELADPSAYDERAFGYLNFQDLCARTLRDVCGSNIIA